MMAHLCSLLHSSFEHRVTISLYSEYEHSALIGTARTLDVIDVSAAVSTINNEVFL